MLKINGWNGEETVFVTRGEYSNNGNTAIQLYCFSEYEDNGTVERFIEPWAKLTVNLEDLPNDMCYLDTNNCPQAEEFMRKYEIGFPTGLYAQSGFCTYPLYIIDLKRLDELVEQGERERGDKIECYMTYTEFEELWKNKHAEGLDWIEGVLVDSSVVVADDGTYFAYEHYLNSNSSDLRVVYIPAYAENWKELYEEEWGNWDTFKEEREVAE